MTKRGVVYKRNFICLCLWVHLFVFSFVRFYISYYRLINRFYNSRSFIANNIIEKRVYYLTRGIFLEEFVGTVWVCAFVYSLPIIDSQSKSFKGFFCLFVCLFIFCLNVAYHRLAKPVIFRLDWLTFLFVAYHWLSNSLFLKKSTSYTI